MREYPKNVLQYITTDLEQDCPYIYNYVNKIEKILGKEVFLGKVVPGREFCNCKTNECFILMDRFGIIIAFFTLRRLDGCCGIIVSANSVISEGYRNKGIGTILHKFRIYYAKKMGYTLMLCTDKVKNIPQLNILNNHGWEHLKTFKNIRTFNTLNLSVLDLTNIKYGDLNP